MFSLSHTAPGNGPLPAVGVSSEPASINGPVVVLVVVLLAGEECVIFIKKFTHAWLLVIVWSSLLLCNVIECQQ